MGFVVSHSKHLRNNFYVHVDKCQTICLSMLLLISLAGFIILGTMVKIHTYNLQHNLVTIYAIIIVIGYWTLSVLYSLFGFDGLFVEFTNIEIFIQSHICLAQDLADYLEEKHYDESVAGRLLITGLDSYFWIDLTAFEKSVQACLIILSQVIHTDGEPTVECVMYVVFNVLWICDDWITLTCYQSNVSNTVVAGDMLGGWINRDGHWDPRLTKKRAKLLREQYRIILDIIMGFTIASWCVMPYWYFQKIYSFKEILQIKMIYITAIQTLVNFFICVLWVIVRYL